MNVLLVVLDSVRARNVSLYGHENRTTPFLETFAEQATTYTQARSPGSWSLPSHTSMFTGLHVAEHGVTAASDKLEPGHTIFDYLADEHGYDTGIFTENTWVTEMDVGLKESFDTVEGARNVPYTEGLDPSNFVLTEGQGNYLGYLRRCLDHDHPVKSLANGVVTKLAWDYPQYLPESLKATTPADVYVDLFLDWIDGRSDNWAACINMMDGHMPYEPAPEHDRWGGDNLRAVQNRAEDQVWEYLGGHRPWWEKQALSALYDGTIHQMDAQLRRLVESLENREILEETLLVVTSDHGEGFGEPSQVKPDTRLAGHGKDVHDVLLHVPLVVKFPEQSEPEQVTEPASLTEFPAVVQDGLDGSWACDAFVPNGPVVSSTHGLDEPSEKLARQYCGDTEPYRGVSRAVFKTTGDGSVVHYQSWNERAVTVRAVNAEVNYISEYSGGEVVAETFERFQDAAVRVDRDGVPDVDNATEERLKNLGYM